MEVRPGRDRHDVLTEEAVTFIEVQRVRPTVLNHSDIDLEIPSFKNLSCLDAKVFLIAVNRFAFLG